MSVDEHARHQLYNRVVEVLGEEEADILMAHLPPGGYPNPATKQDLLDLENRLDGRFQALEQRLKVHTLRVVLTTNVATVAVVVGIWFTIAGLR